MKTLKHLLLLFAIICLSFLLQNCGKKMDCGDNDSVTEYKIHDDDLQKIPYTGFETLTFVNTTAGDTHTFVANEWKQYWGNTSTQEDCPQKESYEKRELIFSSNTFPHPITVSISRDPVSGFTLLDIQFQNTVFRTSPGRIRSPYDIDSLNILGTQYYSIIVASDLDSATPETYKCYYNTEAGILKMVLENGEIWELVKNK